MKQKKLVHKRTHEEETEEVGMGDFKIENVNLCKELDELKCQLFAMQ